LDAFIPSRHIIDAEQLDEFTQHYSDDHILDSITKTIDSRPLSTLVELTAPETCSGKSALIYHAVASAVLPRFFNGSKIDGKNGIAVVFDTDDRFDASILQRTIKNTIGQKLQQINETEAASTIDLDANTGLNPDLNVKVNITSQDLDKVSTEILSQVHIFRPQTFQSLLATLDQLPLYLFELHSHRAVQTIILDSASAFYWQLRADQELRKIQALDGQNEAVRIGPATPSYLALIQRLRSLSEKFECSVIVSTWDLAPSNQPLISRLNPTLPVTPNVRLEVYRSPTRRFPDNISVEQAHAQRSLRDDAVRRHEFQVTNGSVIVTFNMRFGTVDVES
jgi:hypothetical protein